MKNFKDSNESSFNQITLHIYYSYNCEGNWLGYDTKSKASFGRFGRVTFELNYQSIVQSELNKSILSSERVSKTNVNGVLLTEAKYINLSLHYLEQVYELSLSLTLL
jgi:hypothetical protein